MAPSSSIPPPLPPSVEEAYHRKCIQLKQRTDEVEEANDAAQLRLNRLKRQVEKMRLERAFLLEQLQRRTSTNVEDSEGSPSPPPTAKQADQPLLPEPQPKEKPLRIKRGHRKASLLANIETSAPGAGSSSAGPSNLLTAQNLNTLSPSSDAFSHSHADLAQTTTTTTTTQKPANGVGGKLAAKKPATAFELYSAETKPSIQDDDEKAVEEELAKGWKDLSEARREEYQALADQELEKYQASKESAAKAAAAAAATSPSGSKAKKDSDRSSTSVKAAGAADEGEGEGEGEAEAAEGEGEVEGDDDDGRRDTAEDTPMADARDEDVEMENYDSGEETQGERD